MKRLLYVVIALVVLPVFTQAQDRDRDQIRLEDHLLLKDGIVLQIRDRDQTQLKDQIKLEDGTLVNPDGSYVNENGDRLRLRDGECLDMDGNFYSSAEQLQQQVQLRNQVRNQLHYAYENGKVYQIKNQQRQLLRNQVALENGGILNPDGTYQAQNQKQLRLRDGECLDPNGNFFNNEAQFRKQEQRRLQAMNQDHFMYKDGQMYQYQNGERKQLRNQLALQNGLTVDPDGVFQMRNQDRIQLRDGECLDPDGNMYGSQEQFLQQAQVRMQARNQEHYVYENGAMYRVKNEQRIRVREGEALQNGLTVAPDGTYKFGNKKRQKLRDGECLDPDGNKYKNQSQFQQHMHNQMMAMSEPHFIYQNGQVYKAQNRVRMELQNRWVLENGVIINPDGTYKLKNGKQKQMKEGEVLDWEGNAYQDRERFREKMELKIREHRDMMNRDRIDRMERKQMQGERKRIGG